MRIVFMGTPDLAKVCLEAVYAHPAAEIVGVLTQPDKPKGRGMKMVAPPVKVFAEEKGLPVYQPVTLKDGAFADELAKLDPELIIVAAYGKILPAYVLDYPKYGCVNAHGSLLPKYRGASPIQRAIMDGETETGITAMYMNQGLDTGDMILKLTCPITDEDDFGTLHDTLAELAGEAMCMVIDRILDGTVDKDRTVQPEEGVCYAAKIEKADTLLSFAQPAEKLFCQIRGLSPMPYAMTHTPDGKILKITTVKRDKTEKTYNEAPGTVVDLAEGIRVVCGDGKTLLFTGVVPEGKSRMAAVDYIRGRKIAVGDVLGKDDIG